jgi:hypothetical protein
MKLAMSEGAASGWYDSSPWPEYSAAYPEVLITNVASQTEFTVEAGTGLLGGAASLSGDDAPQVMVWDEDTSRWEWLDVTGITDDGSNEYTITLGTTPTTTIATNQRISPYTDRLDVIAEAVEAYFDELGPGEVVDLDTDSRAHRAMRQPRPSGYYPYRAGHVVLARVIEALGGSTSDVELTSISETEPDLPGDIVDGPRIITLGGLSIFPL